MSSPAGLLDFYILEANEYIDQLDTLLASATEGPPDLGSFVTAARALRGSSTMARQAMLASLASGLERLGRSTRDGTLPWSPRTRSAAVAAIDDFRILLRSVRNWGTYEDGRAESRIAELNELAPQSQSGAPSPSSATDPSFFATEIEAIANSLDAYLGNPRDPRALDLALGRIRALRGIAALKDVPPLADVGDAVERAARTRPGEHGVMRATYASLFDAAARLFRRAAADLRRTGRPDPSTPEIARFASVVAALDSASPDDDQVVPISNLYYADGGPHVVSRAHTPPTTSEHRFRTDIVGPAEHLRRLVADARAASDIVARERAARELRHGVRSLRAVAESYGHETIGQFFDESLGEGDAFDHLNLSAIEEAAGLLANPGVPPEAVARRLADLSRGRVVDRAIGAGLGPIDAPRRTPVPKPRSTPVTPIASPRSTPGPISPSAITPRMVTPVSSAAGPPPAPVSPRIVPKTPSGPRRPAMTPTGHELRTFLQDGIAGFHDLDERPLSEPAPLDEAAVVPIDALLYRGRTALERARELRDAVRSSAGRDTDALDELFDLLDLAASE
jgi:hypothetical protein